MEIDAVEESKDCCLKSSHFWISIQKLQVDMAMQVFMNRSIPLSRKFIEVSSVPKILVKLSVRKPTQFCVKVCAKLEYEKE
jgi:hypothetical protein